MVRSISALSGRPLGLRRASPTEPTRYNLSRRIFHRRADVKYPRGMATSKNPVPMAQPSTVSDDETPSGAADPETEQRQQRAARVVLRAAHDHFGAPNALDLAAFDERYPEASCLQLASGSRARNSMRAAARIVKQLLPQAPGAPDPTRGLRPSSIALVVYHAQLVDVALTAVTPLQPRAAQRATQSLAQAEGTRQLNAAEASVARAIGKNHLWRKVYEEGRAAQAGRRRDLGDRLEQCAGGLQALRTLSATSAHSLAMEGLDAGTEAALRAQAGALESASMSLQAPLTAGQDSRELNILEGRLLHAVADLLRAVRQARQEGKTALVLRVAPVLLRQLRMSRGKGSVALMDDSTKEVEV